MGTLHEVLKMEAPIPLTKKLCNKPGKKNPLAKLEPSISVHINAKVGQNIT